MILSARRRSVSSLTDHRVSTPMQSLLLYFDSRLTGLYFIRYTISGLNVKKKKRNAMLTVRLCVVVIIEIQTAFRCASPGEVTPNLLGSFIYVGRKIRVERTNQVRFMRLLSNMIKTGVISRNKQKENLDFTEKTTVSNVQLLYSLFVCFHTIHVHDNAAVQPYRLLFSRGTTRKFLRRFSAHCPFFNVVDMNL